MGKPGKATNAHMVLRLKEVTGFVRRGFTRAMILRLCADKWGIKERMSETLIARSRAVFNKEFKKDLPNQANEILASFDEIYERAMYEGTEKNVGKDQPVIYVADLHAAIAAKMSKAKVLGLLKTNVHVTGDLNDMEAMSSDEITKGASE